MTGLPSSATPTFRRRGNGTLSPWRTTWWNRPSRRSQGGIVHLGGHRVTGWNRPSWRSQRGIVRLGFALLLLKTYQGGHPLISGRRNYRIQLADEHLLNNKGDWRAGVSLASCSPV